MYRLARPIYSEGMAESLKELGGKAIALVVLLLAAFLLFKIVLGVLSALAWTFLGVAVLVGAIWALSRLL
jgi:hypothetical protein